MAKASFNREEKEKKKKKNLSPANWT